jgi:hypothetical protein
MRFQIQTEVSSEMKVGEARSQNAAEIKTLKDDILKGKRKLEGSENMVMMLREEHAGLTQ